MVAIVENAIQSPPGATVGGLIDLDRFLNPAIIDPGHKVALHRTFETATPFEHLVIDDLFDGRFLVAVAESLTMTRGDTLRHVTSAREDVLRSNKVQAMPAAVKAYFHLVNSATFLDVLRGVTGIDNLIVDATLRGGGLHESRRGGHFGVHRDVEHHAATMLTNALVVITYLNPGWEEDYGGALELWSKTECVKKIFPNFGRTVILKHSSKSFHGHPHALNAPEGVVRRSLASYYYTNPYGDCVRQARPFTRFLADEDRPWAPVKLRHAAAQITPPIVWTLLRRARGKAKA